MPRGEPDPRRVSAVAEPSEWLLSRLRPLPVAYIQQPRRIRLRPEKDGTQSPGVSRSRLAGWAVGPRRRKGRSSPSSARTRVYPLDTACVGCRWAGSSPSLVPFASEIGWRIMPVVCDADTRIEASSSVRRRPQCVACLRLKGERGMVSGSLPQRSAKGLRRPFALHPVP